MTAATKSREGRNIKTISLEQSVATIPDGAILMIGGFMGVGTAERLIDELVRRKTAILP
jgi:acetate CoA/acetoacetate CoA-transferase alpha subunit